MRCLFCRSSEIKFKEEFNPKNVYCNQVCQSKFYGIGLINPDKQINDPEIVGLLSLDRFLFELSKSDAIQSKFLEEKINERGTDSYIPLFIRSTILGYIVNILTHSYLNFDQDDVTKIISTDELYDILLGLKYLKTDERFITRIENEIDFRKRQPKLKKTKVKGRFQNSELENLPLDWRNVIFGFLSKEEQNFYNAILDRTDVNQTLSNDFFYNCARNGYIGLFVWAQQQNPYYPWNPKICAKAAEGNQEEFLRWARKQNPSCPWDFTTADSLAQNRNLNLLKWANQNNCPIPWSVGTKAIENADFNILNWLHENFLLTFTWLKFFHYKANHLLNFEIIKWLKEKYPQVSLDNSLYFFAAKKNRKDIIDYGFRNGGNFNKDLFNGAIEGQHMDLIRWAIDNNCPCNYKSYDYAIWANRIDIMKLLRTKNQPCPWNSKVCSTAAEAGNLEILKWLRNQDPPCPWDENTCASAAKKGNLEILKWVRSQDEPCPWNEETCKKAASGNHLEVLKWARKNGAPWDADTCTQAAIYGHINILEWCRSQTPPCPWNEDTCEGATLNAQFKTLRWLREQKDPCPWDTRTCGNIAMHGRLDILKWARKGEDPCPWNEETIENSIDSENLEMIIWMLDNGCPRNLNLKNLAEQKKQMHIFLYLNKRFIF